MKKKCICLAMIIVLCTACTSSKNVSDNVTELRESKVNTNETKDYSNTDGNLGLEGTNDDAKTSETDYEEAVKVIKACAEDYGNIKNKNDCIDFLNKYFPKDGEDFYREEWSKYAKEENIKINFPESIEELVNSFYNKMETEDVDSYDYSLKIIECSATPAKVEEAKDDFYENIKTFDIVAEYVREGNKVDLKNIEKYYMGSVYFYKDEWYPLMAEYLYGEMLKELFLNDVDESETD